VWFLVAGRSGGVKLLVDARSPGLVALHAVGEASGGDVGAGFGISVVVIRSFSSSVLHKYQASEGSGIGLQADHSLHLEVERMIVAVQCERP